MADITEKQTAEKQDYSQTTDKVAHHGDIEKGEDGLAKRIRHSFSATGDEAAIEGQLFSMSAVDPALDAKMKLVNDVGRIPGVFDT